MNEKEARIRILKFLYDAEKQQMKTTVTIDEIVKGCPELPKKQVSRILIYLRDNKMIELECWIRDGYVSLGLETPAIELLEDELRPSHFAGGRVAADAECIGVGDGDLRVEGWSL